MAQHDSPICPGLSPRRRLVATAGDATGATSGFVLPLVGALTILTTFISPYLIRFAWKPRDRGDAPPPATPAVLEAIEAYSVVRVGPGRI